MLERILSGPQQELLSAVRRRLGELQATLARAGAADADQRTLADSLARLDELFLLVVAGEFNSGKSAFINALVGDRLLEEGVTPTTSRIHVLRHGAVRGSRLEGGVEVVTAPLPLLEELQIVDTPGTNAILRQHEAITREFVPNSDLVLFVTSADRPLAESERAFLETIRQWGKKVVIVLNKIDLILRDEDVERIEAFIADGAHELLGASPAIFPLSARRALAAKLGETTGDAEAALEASRFGAFERYLVDTLDRGERVRLKLASPVGVGERLAGRYLEVAEQRLGLLAGDVGALDDIESQLGVWRQDMEREFRYRLSDVDKELHAFENRGHEFFDDTLRLGRVADLLNRSRLRADFERKVVADLPREIERRVAEVIDWMVDSELKLWQGVSARLAQRQAEHAGRITGAGAFETDRSRLLARVGDAARTTVEGYDRERESARLADSVQAAVAGAALLEVGAIGLGATVAAIATSTAIDVTGLLAAGAMAVLGLIVIPARRKRAKRELKDRVADLRRRLAATLEERFAEEIEASVHRIRDGIAPYTRFVRAERERLTGERDAFAATRDGLADLRGEIGRLS
jgi:small GTP-binding protein